MALSISQTAALMKILKPGMRIASMGYPDIIAPPEMIEQWVGHPVNPRDDSKVICLRHGIKPRPIPDAESLFKLLDCELDVYDIVQERGCEHLCDLNYAWASMGENGTQQRYDIVLDVGTVEHCFNIAQAMFNMAAVVNEGGVIIHENPANQMNHGFYNLNPTFFADFYSANGFELIQCSLVTKEGEAFKVPLTQRFQYTAREINIFCMAQRTEVKPFVYPTQSKYAQAAAVDRAKEKANG